MPLEGVNGDLISEAEGFVNPIYESGSLRYPPASAATSFAMAALTAARTRSAAASSE
jgi:hypothetical protein